MSDLRRKAHEAVDELDKFVPPCEGCGCDRNISKRAHAAIDAAIDEQKKGLCLGGMQHFWLSTGPISAWCPTCGASV